MSKFKNFLWVALAFIMDAITVFMWYIVLFPTETATNITVVIASVLVTIFTAFIVMHNWAIFSTSLAEDS